MSNTKKLHPSDYMIITKFIDYVTFKKKESVSLEISARYVAELLGINPNMKNHLISRKFRRMLDAKMIVIKSLQMNHVK